MAQTDANIKKTVTTIGLESSPGTIASSLYRLHCVLGSMLNGGFATEMLAVPNESPVRFDNPKRAKGLETSKWGPLKIQWKGVPTAAQLGAAGTVTALSQRPFLRHGFGREYAALGCTIGTGSNTTTLVVDSTTARRAGELILVEVSSGVWEVAKVGAVTDSTHLALIHALSASPTNGLGVRGMYNYAIADTRNSTLSIEQRMVDSGHEYRVLGAAGALKIDLPAKFGEIPTFSLDGEAMGHEGPATLADPAFSESSDPEDDDMGDPFVWRPTIFLDSTIERASDSQYRLEALTLEFMSAMDPIPDASKANAVGGYLDVSGRDGDVFAKGTIRIRADSAEVTNFLAGTIRRMLITLPATGAGSVAALELARLYITGEPKPIVLGKGRHGMEFPFELLRDTTCTEPGSPSSEAKDLARSPLRFAIG